MSKPTTLLLLTGALGCTGPDTHAITSAVNEDPGATTLRFHKPAGPVLEIRSVTPSGQVDPVDIYLCFENCPGDHGEQKGPPNEVAFQGDLVGKQSANPLVTSAAIAPLTAVLVGLATPEDFTAVTGLSFDPAQTQGPTESVSLDFAKVVVEYAAGFATLKEGPAAGTLAHAYLGELGIDPCPTAGVVAGE